jgi:hypothetical protein
VVLDKKKCYVVKDDDLILTGTRNTTDGLWDIVLPQPGNLAVQEPTADHEFEFQSPIADPKLAVILRKNQTKTDLTNYFHATCYSPAPSTFIRAVKNNHFTTWPGLDAYSIKKHLTKSIATQLGHLNQERQGLQSTKVPFVAIKQEDDDDNFFPQSDTPNIKTNDAAYSIIQFTPKDKAYIDLTGRFPYTSSRGNQYILVGYHYDSNAILVTPLKNRTAGEITNGWAIINNQLMKAGMKPNTYVLDNEVSEELTTAMHKNNIQYQLVPPHMHRSNLAERAIQTFKNHFKAGLATTDPNFPLSEWDRLLHQAQITLNLLRSARVNPALSAHAYLFGEYNFMRTPMAPPGTKIISHSKPTARETWAPNGEEGWYIGPSLNHYRCVNCYYPRTRAERHTDTVVFFPSTVKLPEVGLKDFLKQAALDIISLLTKPPTTMIPSLAAGDPTRNALLQVATALQRCTASPEAPTAPTALSEVTAATEQTTETMPSVTPVVVTAPRVEAAQPITPPVSTLPRVDVNTTPSIAPVPPSPRVEMPDIAPPPIVPTVTPPVIDETSSPLHDLDLLNKKHRATRVPAPSANRTYDPKVKQSFIQQRYGLRPKRKQNYSFRHRAARHLLAQHVFQRPQAMHVYNAQGKKETVDSLIHGSEGATWRRSLSNELGRLAQGNDYNVKATDTINFIPQSEVPQGRDVTYANFVCDYRPLKSEKYRIRLVVGGDKLTYDDDSGSPAASLLETKLLLNSVISDAKQGAQFMSCDLKDFFLATPMEKPEYMKIPWKYIPQDIRDRYNLETMVTADNYIYVKIKKGMYGLKQAAVLAYDNLVHNLAKSGYTPIAHTIGMWQHDTKRTKFCLCVDDFGVKYFCKDDAEHLLQSLRKDYTCTVDWTGRNFCGLTMDWHYDKEYVDISMPDYVRDALHRFQHDPKQVPQYSPHIHTPIKYGERIQYAKAPDSSAPLDKKDTKRVQSIVGTFLYYARAIDSTYLTALNEIASQQSKPTQQTLMKCHRLLDYAATYPDAYVRFYASDMILQIETDAAYLVMPKARSRIAGHFSMGNHLHTKPHPKLNGAVLIECKTLKHVVASAAEAEIGGIFHNAQMAIPIRTILNAMGHPQPPTPIKTDNATAQGFVYKNINQKKSKSWDMRYYWLRDKENQQMFKIFWERGIDNNADYFTKHHSTGHHREIRARYVQDAVKQLHQQVALMFQQIDGKCPDRHRQCEGVLIHDRLPGSGSTDDDVIIGTEKRYPFGTDMDGPKYRYSNLENAISGE